MTTSAVATPVASPLRGLVPGVLICATVALAARFLSDHYGQIAALGIKTSFKRLTEVGIRPVAMMIGETVYLAVSVLVAMWLLDVGQLP